MQSEAHTTQYKANILKVVFKPEYFKTPMHHFPYIYSIYNIKNVNIYQIS